MKTKRKRVIFEGSIALIAIVFATMFIMGYIRPEISRIFNLKKISSIDIQKISKRTIEIKNINLEANPTIGANISFHESNDGGLFLWYFSGTKLYDYSVAKSAIVDSLVLPRELHIYPAEVEFYPNSDKSIYFLRKNKNEIDLLSGGTLSKFLYGTSNSTHPHKNSIDLYSLFFQFKVEQNNVLLYKVPNLMLQNDSERNQYFSSKTLSIFKLQDSSIIEKNNFSEFPDQYRKNFYNEFYPFVCRKNDSIYFYMFSDKNIIYEHNINNRSSDIAHSIDGITENNLKPCEIDSLNSYTYLKRYAIAGNKFCALDYDTKTKQFIILQTIAIDAESAKQGRIQIYDNKPVKAYVLNSDFACTKKINFPDQKKYSFYKRYIHNNKMYLPCNKNINKKNNALTIDVYDL